MTNMMQETEQATMESAQKAAILESETMKEIEGDDTAETMTEEAFDDEEEFEEAEGAEGEAPKKHRGRPKNKKTPQYQKDLRRDCAEQERCKQSQANAFAIGKAFCHCIAHRYGEKVRNTPKEMMFWISPYGENNNVSLVGGISNEDKYKAHNIGGFLYRINSVLRPQYNASPLSTRILFERVIYPKSYFTAPTVSFTILEVIQRMLTHNENNALYFMDKAAYKYFLNAAAESAQAHKLDTDCIRLIRENYNVIMRELDTCPDKYDINNYAGYWEDYSKLRNQSLNSMDDNELKNIAEHIVGNMVKIIDTENLPAATKQLKVSNIEYDKPSEAAALDPYGGTIE